MSGYNTAIVAAAPWLTAEPDSIWEVTGTYGGGQGTFTRCLARVLPETITGSDQPFFEILIYGKSEVVPAAAITRATELLLVYADNPSEAYYLADQDTIDRHAQRAAADELTRMRTEDDDE